MTRHFGSILAVLAISSCQIGNPTESEAPKFQVFSLRVVRGQSVTSARFDSAFLVRARLNANPEYSKSASSRHSDGYTDFLMVPNGVPYTVSAVGKGTYGALLWFGKGSGTTDGRSAGINSMNSYVIKVGLPVLDPEILGVWVKATAQSRSDTLVFDNSKYRTPYAEGYGEYLDASDGKIHCGTDMEPCGEYRIGKANGRDTLHFKGIRLVEGDSLVWDRTESVHFRVPSGVLAPEITDLTLAYDTLFLGGGATGINAAAVSPKGPLQVSFQAYLGAKDCTDDFAIAVSKPEASSSSWDASTKGDFGILPRSSAQEGRYDLVLAVDNEFGRTKRTIPFVVKAADFGKDQPTSVFSNGVIYNRTSPYTGAFDLIGRVPVDRMGDSTAKDLEDATEAGGDFDGTIMSRNRSQFVKAGPEFSFERATFESMADAFTGTPVTRFTARLGDVWIVRIPRWGSRVVAAIKITQVHVEMGSEKDGFVKFMYRR